MEKSLIHPSVAERVSRELEDNGEMIDYNELRPTSLFDKRGMRFADMLHGTLSRLVRGVDYSDDNPFPLFSVRVFEPGLHGTTIHRNDISIGPWALGITLRGEAPFNVYEQDQLSEGMTVDLVGDERDPEPLDSMDTRAGSAWALYTKYEQMPHSSGIVNSQSRRELLILYGSSYRYDL